MSLETLDSVGLHLEIRVSNCLHANMPDSLCELLDVPPPFAAEICRRFIVASRENFHLRRQAEKKGASLQSLRDDWEAQRKTMVREVLREAQKHD